MPVSLKSKRARVRRRGRPRGSTSDATRRDILDAASACFGERGYGATTNRVIAARAGITSAAIYQYFDSKKALYVEAVRSARRLIVPHLRDAVVGSRSAREGLCALARAHAMAHAKHPGVTPLLTAIPVEVRRHAEIADAMRTEPNEVSQMLAEIARRAVSTGEVAEVTAEGVSSMFLACTMGLSLHASLIGSARFGAATETFAKLLEGTLAGAPPAPRRRSPHGAASTRSRVQATTSSRSAK